MVIKDECISRMDGTVRLSTHVLHRMLERNIAQADLDRLLDSPDHTYMNGSRRVYQRDDIACVVETTTNDVITVLYRSQDRWSSEDGRPSGRVLSKNTRRRMEAHMRRRAQKACAA